MAQGAGKPELKTTKAQALLTNQFNAEQALGLVGVRQRPVSIVANHNAELNKDAPNSLNRIGVRVNASVGVGHGLAGVPPLPLPRVHEYSVAKQRCSLAGDGHRSVAFHTLNRAIDGPNAEALGIIFWRVQVEERETSGRDAIPGKLVQSAALRVVLAVGAHGEIEQQRAVGSEEPCFGFEAAVAIDWDVDLVEEALWNGAVIDVAVKVHELLRSLKHDGVGNARGAGLAQSELHGHDARAKGGRKGVDERDGGLRAFGSACEKKAQQRDILALRTQLEHASERLGKVSGGGVILVASASGLHMASGAFIDASIATGNRVA